MGVRGKLTRGISVVAIAALGLTAFAAPLSAQRDNPVPAPNSGDLPGGDTSVPAVTETAEHRFERGASPLLSETIAGPEALDSKSHLLEEVAARNRMSVDRLVHMLEDPTTRLDQDGMLLYVEPVMDLVDHEPGFEGPMSTPAPLDQTFLLNSKPGASRTIYLDFDGHVVSNTVWNTGNHSVPNGFQALPYDTDGNPGSFSAAERTAIQFVWAMVAEDFAPFDVNVTTQDPGFDAINRSSSSDQVYGTRLVVTGSSPSGFCGTCGGVAYVGVFNWTNSHAFYQPAWCFTSSTNPKHIAECASHEVGHNLGLGHDGIHGGSSYYGGHSPWAPIMGVGYSQPVSQWSKGEYTNANNQQDDLSVMTTFGIPVRADDHSNNVNTATLIGSFQKGIISTSQDFDAFRFLAPDTGSVTFRASPATTGPNLDILLRLFEIDQGGNPVLLAESNPTATRLNASTASGLDAAITRTVTAGRVYIIQVSGTGLGSPLTGYSDYASLGQYTVTVEGMAGLMAGDSFGLVDRTTGRWYLFDATTWQTTSFFFGNPGDYPIMGDWNCDGTDTPGQYRQSDGFVYLRNTNTEGNANIRFYFGNPGDVPIVGDFNGNNCDTVSIYRPSNQTFYIVNKLGANEGGLGAADFSFVFGNPGDKPFTADFDNDGITEVGLHRESTGLIYYRNTLTTGAAHGQFIYGNPGDRIISGRWATNGGAGPETVGLFRPGNGTIYLRYSNSAGAANYTMPYGNSNMWPVAGEFGNLPGGGPIPPG